MTRPVPWLFVLAGSSLPVAGVFEVDRPTDPETAGELIHSNTAVAAFVLLVGAMVLFAIACRHDERWSSMRWSSLGLAVIAAGAAMATQLGYGTGTAGGCSHSFFVSPPSGDIETVIELPFSSGRRTFDRAAQPARVLQRRLWAAVTFEPSSDGENAFGVVTEAGDGARRRGGGRLRR